MHNPPSNQLVEQHWNSLLEVANLILWYPSAGHHHSVCALIEHLRHMCNVIAYSARKKQKHFSTQCMFTLIEKKHNAWTNLYVYIYIYTFIHLCIFHTDGSELTCRTSGIYSMTCLHSAIMTIVSATSWLVSSELPSWTLIRSSLCFSNFLMFC